MQICPPQSTADGGLEAEHPLDPSSSGAGEPSLLWLDLSHPLLCQFYIQQRLFYRQIYAQQLAALSARLGLVRLIKNNIPW
jgi:hypothetical protein